VDKITLQLVNKFAELDLKTKGHELLLENYAKRIDDLESKVRDLTRALYENQK